MTRARAFALLLAIALLGAAGVWLANRTSEPPPAPGRLMFGRWQTRALIVAAALVWTAAALLLSCASRVGAKRFVAATVSTGIAWGVLELAGIAGWVSYPALLGPRARDSLGRTRVAGLDVSGKAGEDLAAGWGLPRPPIAFRFRTDENGIRNPPGRTGAEIVCIGDSVLVDGLVPEQDLVTAHLERLLGRTASNLALVGIGPQQEEELLDEVRPALDGRLVLQFAFEGNDLLDSRAWRAREATADEPEIERGGGWRARTLANQVVIRLQAWTDPMPAFLRQRRGTIGTETYYFQWLSQSFEGLEDEIPFVTESLGRLRTRVEQAGGRYVLVLVPTKLRVLGGFCRFEEGSEIADWQAQCGPLPESLRAWCERASIPFVDLTEALRASTRAGAVPWFPADTHWNSVGHAVAAEAIAASQAVREWAEHTDR